MIGLDILTKNEKKVTSLLLNQSTDITRRLTIISLGFLLMLTLTTTLKAQADITAITTTTVAGTSTSNLNVIIPSDALQSLTDDRGEEITVNYGQGNNLRVVSYTVGGNTFDNFLAPDTLVLNRAVPSDRLVNIWLTLTNTINQYWY